MPFRRHIIRSNVVTMFNGVRLGKYTAGGVSTYTRGKHRVLIFRGLNKDV